MTHDLAPVEGVAILAGPPQNLAVGSWYLLVDLDLSHFISFSNHLFIQVDTQLSSLSSQVKGKEQYVEFICLRLRFLGSRHALPLLIIGHMTITSRLCAFDLVRLRRFRAF